MTKVLSAAEIASAQDRRRELVEIPEWGGSVYVQEISAADAEEIANAGGGYVAYAAAALCDENGNRLFSREQVEDLGNKSPRALRRVYETLANISGAGDAEGKS